jgi:hypothetical protein
MKSGQEPRPGVSACVCVTVFFSVFPPEDVNRSYWISCHPTPLPVSNETAPRESQQVPGDFVRTATGNVKEKYAP